MGMEMGLRLRHRLGLCLGTWTERKAKARTRGSRYLFCCLSDLPSRRREGRSSKPRRSATLTRSTASRRGTSGRPSASDASGVATSVRGREADGRPRATGCARRNAPSASARVGLGTHRRVRFRTPCPTGTRTRPTRPSQGRPSTFHSTSTRTPRPRRAQCQSIAFIRFDAACFGWPLFIAIRLQMQRNRNQSKSSQRERQPIGEPV